MFFHRKQLMLDVKCQDLPIQLFGQMLLEQFGGATGELTAALTYWTQSFHAEDPAIRDSCRTWRSKSSAISRWSDG